MKWIFVESGKLAFPNGCSNFQLLNEIKNSCHLVHCLLCLHCFPCFRVSRSLRWCSTTRWQPRDFVLLQAIKSTRVDCGQPSKPSESGRCLDQWVWRPPGSCWSCGHNLAPSATQLLTVIAQFTWKNWICYEAFERPSICESFFFESKSWLCGCHAMARPWQASDHNLDSISHSVEFSIPSLGSKSKTNWFLPRFHVLQFAGGIWAYAATMVQRRTRSTEERCKIACSNHCRNPIINHCINHLTTVLTASNNAQWFARISTFL